MRRSQGGSRICFARPGPVALALAGVLGLVTPAVPADQGGVLAATVGRASAQTMPGVLVEAYQNNPQLNAERARVRATDENVPQALSGYRPRVSVTASASHNYVNTETKSTDPHPSHPQDLFVTREPATHLFGEFNPYSVGGTATQTLFNGFQTANRTRFAEGQVSAAREALRVLEQTVLLSSATIYMDVLRDTAIAEVNRTNVRVLEETLQQTRDRFNVGEVTRTDVAQSEAQLAVGQFQLLTADANLNTTRANFRRIIGIEPGKLAPASPVDNLAPGTLAAALQLGLDVNPNVTSAMYGVDTANLQVRINEGALFPTVTATGTMQQNWHNNLTQQAQRTWSVGASVTVPIYQGGGEYALIRQSKESLSQQRLNLEQVRDQVRQQINQAWGELQATKAQIESAQAQVRASETALNGVREEARVGQRTTLDVLNAQQTLVNARVTLVTAQRERVVKSYNLLNAVGILSPPVLRLATPVYDPRVHYHQIRDAWWGLRTPDGK